jgi:hypothetical protein
MGCLLHALRTHRAALVALCLERYAHTCPDGDHDGQVARGYLFNCLQPAEPILGTRGSSGAALSQKLGAGAQATRSGPKAALSHEAGAGAAEARDGPGAAPSQEAGTRDTWRPQSCPKPGGGNRGLGTRGHARLPYHLS